MSTDDSSPKAGSTTSSFWTTVRRVVATDAFVEKAVILVLTAIISGLTIPIVITYINAQAAIQQKEVENARAAKHKLEDENRVQRQKELDDRRARYDKIVQAKSDLLRDFTVAAITYATLSLDVSWFGSTYLNNPDLQARALARYSDRIVDLWATLRVTISQAHVLASADMAAELDSILTHFYTLDQKMMVLSTRNDSATSEWAALHEENEKTLQTIQKLIVQLAKNLELGREQR
ncbi:MAG: hypothetical protein AB7P20_00285 [Rhizobiaceae bacterium]